MEWRLLRRFVGVVFVCALLVGFPVSEALAGAPSSTKESFLDAQFFSQQGCLNITTLVMAAAQETGRGGSTQSLASVYVSTHIFDECDGQTVLSVSSYQEVSARSISFDPQLRSASVNARVPMFIPIGPGYNVAVSVSVRFVGRGSTLSTDDRWTECDSAGCHHYRKHASERSGRAEAVVTLPALCGVLFCESMNLTPRPSENAHITILSLTEQTR